MSLDCGCVANEERLVVVFCRACAMNLDQGSDEWGRSRSGCLTASRMNDALAKNRQGTGPGITRLNYQAELVCERLNGFAYEGFQNAYMDRGKEEEDGAVKAYDLFVTPGWSDIEVKPIGFVQHSSIPYFGASPDRVIGQVGLLEVKNRKTNIHFELLRSLKVPSGDIDQVLTEMACAEWVEWCDYVSYDRRAPAGCDLFVRRFYRDDHKARIAEIEQRGQEFLFEVEKLAQELQERAEAGFIFLDREAQRLDDGLETALATSVVQARASRETNPNKRDRNGVQRGLRPVASSTPTTASCPACAETVPFSAISEHSCTLPMVALDREPEPEQKGNEIAAQLAGGLAMLKPDSVVVPIKRKRRGTNDAR